jgi:hypothetical protein
MMRAAMQLVPFGLRAALTSDKDVRRLFWLLRYKKLDETHRSSLLAIRDRAKKGGQWARPGDRETIRVLFNIHRRTTVRVT